MPRGGGRAGNPHGVAITATRSSHALAPRLTPAATAPVTGPVRQRGWIPRPDGKPMRLSWAARAAPGPGGDPARHSGRTEGPLAARWRFPRPFALLLRRPDTQVPTGR